MVTTNVGNGRVTGIRSRVDSSSNTVVRYPSPRLPRTNRLSTMAFILPCLWWVTSPSPCQSLSRPHTIPPSPFGDRRKVLRTMTEEPLLVGLMGRVSRSITTSGISLLTLSTTMTTTTLLDSTAHASSDEEEILRTMPPSSPMIHHHHHPFPYSPEWTGTQFSVRSLDEAVTDPTFILKTVEQHPTITHPTESTTTSSKTTTVWPMARWPDPILRRPADEVDVQSLLESSSSSSSSAALRLMDACNMLVRTAQYHGAVGLAAQQCGINARLIYIQHNPPSSSSSSSISSKTKKEDDVGMVLINPRIVGRSPETDMKVWTEQCLVLPPTWTATVLRDSWIDVDYYTLVTTLPPRQQQPQRTATAASMGGPRSARPRPPPVASSSASPQRGGGITMIRRRRRRLYGETSRCFQHEYDHDRGILLTDHVGWDEMESNVMRELEEEEECRGGHEQRQAIAYARNIDDPLSE
jgi:peptide deformylase